MCCVLLCHVQSDGSKPKVTTNTAVKSASKQSEGGLSPVAIVLLLLAIVLGVYYTQTQQQ
jgi:uncharacterized protein HemX